MSKDNVRSLPHGAVLLQKPQAAPPMRRFSILLVGATDGGRVVLEPPQVSGLTPLEATAILARVASAGLSPLSQAPTGAVSTEQPEPTQEPAAEG